MFINIILGFYCSILSYCYSVTHVFVKKMYKKPKYIPRTSIPMVVRSRLQDRLLGDAPTFVHCYICVMTKIKCRFCLWHFQDVTWVGSAVRASEDHATFWWLKHTFFFLCMLVSDGPAQVVLSVRRRGENNFKLIHRHLAELPGCFWHLCRWQTLKYQLFSPRWEVEKMKLQSPE